MSYVGSVFLSLLREAWVVLTGAVVMFVLLGVLAQVLRSASGSLIGARNWVGNALAASTGLMVLALFSFVGVPAVLRAVSRSLPNTGGCGPISEIGGLAAGLIGALAAVRILMAVLKSVTAAALEGSASLASALLESGEAVLGMIVAAAAIPIAARLLGVC